MKPSASSATDCTKPALACVTSTPAADAAATSMLRMSTAQRTKARSFGRRGKDFAGACGHAVGDDDVGIASSLDQRRRVERLVALVQRDIGNRAQAVQAALAVIVAAHLRGMGEKDLHDVLPLIAHRMRQRGADERHEGDHQQAQQQQAEIASDRLDGLLDRHIADQARRRRAQGQVVVQRARGPSRSPARRRNAGDRCRA